ncbi:MAG: trypsin-like peptidase domain-containing protein [Planctomycetaceae bacterium]|nr:trypsin-like peptidase domain-containing protein [Planctomycetaceae bacterium]
MKVVGRDGRDASFATGFVISEDGLIATAFHSIAKGYGVAVIGPADQQLRVTEIYARLPAADLVVLKVDADSLSPLTFRDARPPDGLDVVAVGHPRGKRNSVVRGVLSRRETIDDLEMLQLSLPVERGSSGEPVVDREGRVIGVVTLKSSVQENTGYAVPVKHLRRMLADPVPIPIDRWETIGRLDAARWQVKWDANWRRRGTGVAVDGYGKSFGGRSLCLWQPKVPEQKFELQVDLRLENEDGAAGLIFCSDGGDRHFGFYPSAGRMRVTRFSGPTVNSWTILKNDPQRAWQPGEWNTLKVRGDGAKFTFWLNGEQIYQVVDDRLAGGQVGLAAFRGTQAQFRRFQVASSIPDLLPDATTQQAITDILGGVRSERPAGQKLVDRLRPYQRFAARSLEHRARDLERQAEQIRRLAADVHADQVQQQLLETLNPTGDERSSPNLLQAALLVARLDNPDVDVQAYEEKVDAIAGQIRATLPPDADRQRRVDALDEMMFRQLGYRGSRFEYYSQANSYLNQVIDDREGLPIALCVLYIELGRRLDVPMEGLGLPGHFVVRIPGEGETTATFVDVFHQGKRMSRDDIETLIADRARMSPTYFEAQSAARIVERMLRNLLGLAEENQADDDIFRYVETLAALNSSEPEYRAKRMMIRAQTDRLSEAIDDVNWFIGNEAFGADLDQFYELRAEFERRRDLQNR